MPKSITIHPDDLKFIKKNRLIMTAKTMAKTLGYDGGVVYRFMKKNNLMISKELSWKLRGDMRRRPFTKREDKYILSQLPISSIKKIAKDLNRTGFYVSRRAKELGLGSIIERNAIESRIKPGSVPPNKGKKMPAHIYEKAKATMFKKGHLPANAKEKNGVISIRHDHPNRNGGRPTKYIRIALGKWQAFSHYVWEKTNGKVPKGHCLWFKDGDSLNCEPDNLELITRAENMRRNTVHNLPKSIVQVVQLRGAINRQINKHIKKLKNEKQDQ